MNAERLRQAVEQLPTVLGDLDGPNESEAIRLQRDGAELTVVRNIFYGSQGSIEGYIAIVTGPLMARIKLSELAKDALGKPTDNIEEYGKDGHDEYGWKLSQSSNKKTEILPPNFDLEPLFGVADKARKLAYNHCQFETNFEHVFYALLDTPEIAKIFEFVGYDDLSNIKGELLGGMRWGNSVDIEPIEVSFTPLVRDFFNEAPYLAHKFGYSSVKPIHLLLVLLNNPSFELNSLWKRFREIDFDRIQKRTLQLIARESPTTPKQPQSLRF